MPRISVSLPEEFMDRLEPVKEKINVSQVCREALERRIVAFQRAAEHGEDDDLDLDGLVDRLRKDRELVEGKFEQLGRESASTWLRTASYLELKAVTEGQSSPDMDGYRLPKGAFKIMKRDMDDADVSCDGVHASVYKTAWLDYLRAVWATVADRLNESDPDTAAEAAD